MTILAQLNDCHSRNDARSIVQKLDAGYPESQKWYVNDVLMSCI